MKKEIVIFRDPKSPISEIFRTLRTNIQFANSKRGLRSLLVTSTCPGEGKSWVSTNLAVAFAQAGKKVILVDSDMRKGRQFSIFGVAPTPGLSNFLSGINSNGEESNPNILSYLKETEVENLYLITAGNIPPNPSELLVSEQMAQTIEELKSVCDLVIFDGTPSSLVTDAVIISRYVDTSLIVSAHKTTKLDDLEKVKKEIENVGGKIAGVVINKIPVSQKQYYAAYYYGSTNLANKNTKSKKMQKEEEKLQIERKKEEIKAKSRTVIQQNKTEYKPHIQENKQQNMQGNKLNTQDYRQANIQGNKSNVPDYRQQNVQQHKANTQDYRTQRHVQENKPNVPDDKQQNVQQHKANTQDYRKANMQGNKQNIQNYRQQNTQMHKESKIYDYDKDTSENNNSNIDSAELLKQITQYVDKEKGNI